MVLLCWLGTKLTKENEIYDISQGFSEHETILQLMDKVGAFITSLIMKIIVISLNQIVIV